MKPSKNSDHWGQKCFQCLMNSRRRNESDQVTSLASLASLVLVDRQAHMKTSRLDRLSLNPFPNSCLDCQGQIRKANASSYRVGRRAKCTLANQHPANQ